MEGPANFENREAIIDELISALAEREKDITADQILSDLMTFSEFEGTDLANPEYFEIIAEQLGISAEELIAYAIKKAAELLADPEEDSE